MRYSGEREYRALLRRLREQAPPRYPVRIVRRSDPDNAGSCDLVRRGASWVFEIEIAKDAPAVLLVEILLHEWAHALAWGSRRKAPMHGRRYGEAWARCYRIWEPPFSWQRTRRQAA